MKHSRRLICLLCTLALLVTALSGCQKKVTSADCPFTEITWGSSPEDIQKAEGSSFETTDSEYKGTTYIYTKEYEGLKGRVEYAFDDKEKLLSMAWTYESDDAEDIQAVYEKLHKETVDALGDGDFATDKNKLNTRLQNSQEKLNKSGMTAPLADVWYLKGGNVIMCAVITSDVKAFQYTFLHPDVSKEKPADK